MRRASGLSQSRARKAVRCKELIASSDRMLLKVVGMVPSGKPSGHAKIGRSVYALASTRWPSTSILTSRIQVTG